MIDYQETLQFYFRLFKIPSRRTVKMLCDYYQNNFRFYGDE
jgi:hypothetical protein